MRTETDRVTGTESGSPPSSAGGHLLPTTMAASGLVPRKHETTCA